MHVVARDPRSGIVLVLAFSGHAHATWSRLECAACLDVLVARTMLDDVDRAPGKDKLVRIVSMLTKLIERLLSAS